MYAILVRPLSFESVLMMVVTNSSLLGLITDYSSTRVSGKSPVRSVKFLTWATVMRLEPSLRPSATILSMSRNFHSKHYLGCTKVPRYTPKVMEKH